MYAQLYTFKYVSLRRGPRHGPSGKLLRRWNGLVQLALAVPSGERSGSIRSTRGLPRLLLSLSTCFPCSRLCAKSGVQLMFCSGIKYSSVSRNAIHSVCDPNRSRQLASAAYWELRSPGFLWLGRLLEHDVAAQHKNKTK